MATEDGVGRVSGREGRWAVTVSTREGRRAMTSSRKKSTKVLKITKKHRKVITYWELMVMLVIKVILIRIK